MKRRWLLVCAITFVLALFSVGFARQSTTSSPNEGNAARPQEPKKPYHYNEEEVSYENKAGGVTLAGTLTVPRGKGPFPEAHNAKMRGTTWGQTLDLAICGFAPLKYFDFARVSGFAGVRHSILRFRLRYSENSLWLCGVRHSICDSASLL